MSKFKKFKVPVIIISILLFSGIVYCGSWLYYYNFIWMPHVKNSSFNLKKEEDEVTKETIYSFKDNLGDIYYISIPRFGSFDCHVATCSTLVFDEAKPIVDANGDTTFESYVQNGSDFFGNMIASFNTSGHITIYKFEISPYIESTNVKYAEKVFVQVTPEGELLSNNLSNTEYAIYKDAYPEIIKFICTTKEVFNIQ